MPTIEIVDYDPAWPQRFEQLRRPVWDVVGDFALSVEHVGSTSVPGLAAKPVIDMSVVVPSQEDVPRAIERLATLGYVHRGNLGIVGREAFHAPPDLPRHHLYVCHQGSLGLRNHLALRDYLRTHPDAAREYGALKKQLAAQFPNDIDRYLDGKTAFITAILREMGLSEEEVEGIEGSNRVEIGD
jgi:GrpB-like predicted nucleotidyltransferase (UPF0157 family)